MNEHCYKPSAVDVWYCYNLPAVKFSDIVLKCYKNSAVNPRHCFGFSARIPFLCQACVRLLREHFFGKIYSWKSDLVIPPGYTWNTAPFPFRKYCRMLTLCWQKAGGKAQHLQEHDTMMRNKCFAKFVFFWRLCKFVRIIFAARLTRRCNWKTMFCNSGVFSATGC